MTGKIAIGSVLILLGASLLLDQLNLFDFQYIAGSFWPVILILMGATQLIQKHASKVTGILFIATGCVFMLINLSVLPGTILNYFWPIVIIFVGAWIILSRKSSINPTKEHEDSVSLNSLASSMEIKNTHQDFQGGYINSFFGSAELDLSETGLGDSQFAELDITCILGNVEITVPKGWRVELNTTPLLSAIENFTLSPDLKDQKLPTLQVRGIFVLSSLTIKH
jgi:predicted membrane protein